MTKKEEERYYCGWIEAKDSKKGRVLISGLGTLGVGSMWFEMTERHRDYPDFEEAPEVDAPPVGEPFGWRDVRVITDGDEQTPPWWKIWQQLSNPKRLHVDEDGRVHVICGNDEYSYDCGANSDFQAAVWEHGSTEIEALGKVVAAMAEVDK